MFVRCKRLELSNLINWYVDLPSQIIFVLDFTFTDNMRLYPGGEIERRERTELHYSV